jgi:site-specific DNA-cytosine methylase
VKLHGASSTEDHETWEEGDTARTLNSMAQAGASGALVTPLAYDDRNQETDGETHHTLRAEGKKSSDAVLTPTRGVRRLTPTECERLQAFPDGWTIPK